MEHRIHPWKFEYSNYCYGITLAAILTGKIYSIASMEMEEIDFPSNKNPNAIVMNALGFVICQTPNFIRREAPEQVAHRFPRWEQPFQTER